MTDRFTHDAAPYVLGALAPEDRRAFEDHLDTCAECRAEVHEFAGIPGLLSRLPAADVRDVLAGVEEPAAPVSVLPAVLHRVGAERRSRRRRAVLAGVAAAGAVAAGSVGLTAALDRPAAVTQVQALAFTRTGPDVPASAEATLTEVPEGTRIAMTCRYSGRLDGRDREYVLRVVPKDGAPRTLGSWPVLSTADYQLVVVAPLPKDRIAEVEVTNGTGTPLLTLRP